MDFEGILRESLDAAKARQAASDGVPIGSYRCDCGHIRDWEAEPCECETRRDVERDLALRRAGLRRAYASIPEGLGFCRTTDPRWEALTIHPRLRELACKWNRKRGAVLVLGDTGVGKTVSTAALLHRILDVASMPGISLVDYDWARRVRYVSGLSLAIARRNSGLGEESWLVEDSMRASLLVLDELGFEVFDPKRDSTLLEVLDQRYLDNKPTIATSGRTETQFRERYGAAIMRRITDRGTVMNLWETP